MRRSGDRVVAGVAAGIGRHYGIDPVLVRILFVITTFAAGLGALAYLVGWIVLPRVEAPAPTNVVPAERGTGFWLGAAAVTVGGAFALGNLPAPRLVIPLALVAIGAALWQRPGSPDTAGRSVGSSVPPPTAEPASMNHAAHEGAANQATGPGTSPESSAMDGAAPTSGTRTWEHAPDVRWWVPPEPRPRPSWLGPIVVALALLATGVVAALGVADVLAVRGSDLVAVALLVLAGGMVVGTVWGRAKWLALPSTALAGMLVVMQLVGTYGVQLVPMIGEQYLSADQLGGTLTARHGIGRIEVDLADAELGTGANVDLDLGIGQAEIVVPDDVTVEVSGQVGIGAVHWYVASGTDPDTGTPIVAQQTLADGREIVLDTQLPSADPDAPVLRLDVAAGIAGIDLYRGREVYDAQRFGGDFGADFEEDFEEDFGGDFGRGFDEPMMSETALPFERTVEDWFIAEVCPATGDDVDMYACWSEVSRDRAALDALAQEGGFFADFCLDGFLVADTPDLVGECLQVLDEAGADVRRPQEEN